ncbi:stage V sporulation protein E [Clostridia bacterium]|nr:stage V sporulation protein E [Clostridia bacterium]
MNANTPVSNGKRRRKNIFARETTNENVVYVKNVDYVVVVAVTVLVIIGVLMVYSSSYYAAVVRFNDDSTRFFKKQAMAAVIGFLTMYVLSYVNYRDLKILAFPLYIIGCVLLALLPIIGVSANGATRWINIPVFGSLQPSEVAKLGIILVLSYIISRQERPLSSLRNVLVPSFFLFIPVGLIAWGNLSTAIVSSIIGVSIMFIASPKVWPFILAGIIGIVCVVMFVLFGGEAWRNARVQAWLDPEAHADGKGWQTIQSLYAIGTGGFFGLGPGQSRQKMGFIPEAYTDIIFSIVCEEFGFMGAAIILVLFIVLIWRGVRIAMNATDLFGTLIATGIVFMLAGQVIMNIAVVTNSMPSTGVPLPFISYGGTSLVISMTSIGVLLNISRYHKPAVKARGNGPRRR